MVDLNQIAGGELAAQFTDALFKVVGNLKDPNTPFKNKRGIIDRSSHLSRMRCGMM